MRTTINIDDKIYNVIKQLAYENDESIGTIVSKLIEDHLNSDTHIQNSRKSRLPVFDPANQAKVITVEEVNRIREEIGE